ncbi:MAG: PaaI family thioesterase [Ardenticatenaceae bacterium]|nr:PaaI family thioesterase [Ardenticatenaceae bacterium]MCB9444975.1 PaaI family thioesterase [Ardenticatenaceae bacterium]
MELSAFPPEFAQRIQALMTHGDLKLPPPIFTEMQAEVIDLDIVAKTLTVRFPVQARYQNPMGYMQGGMIAAAIDNVIGPLSFIVAEPNVTKSMEVQYLRPISDKIKQITVVAAFAGQQDRELTFVADVLRDDGTRLAQARSTNVLLKRKF